MKITNKTILFFIIIVATVLRFYNYVQIPYTHDEFSALFRTNFNTFSELIEKGVKIDGHPAGIQVFLFYWIQLFGSTEWIVKLPFTVMGIASVYLLYVIAKKWFNETVGLLSAAFLATVQFAVFYSQMSRPYASGLFFSLAMVYYWTKIIQTPQSNFLKNTIFFVFFATLCAYNHYFSLLFAGIVGVSGLFYVKKEFLLKYVLSGVSIVILYLPHSSIFLYQLKVGGVESWLGKPHYDFFVNYIAYIFHFSVLLFVLVISIIIYGFVQNKIIFAKRNTYLLFAVWFLLPVTIGFFYSVFFSAVLQYSVLIFSFPFLFFVLFAHIKQQTPTVNLIIVSIIVTVNSLSLVFERNYYTLFYNSPYKEMLIDYYKINKKCSNILSIIDSDIRKTRYYATKYSIDTNFVWFSSFENENGFIQFLEQQSLRYDTLFFAGLSSNNPLTNPIIQDYYPTVEEQKNYVGGSTYIFSKKASQENIFIEKLTFEHYKNKAWNSIDSINFNDAMSVSGNYCYCMDSTSEWGPSFSAKVTDIVKNENNFIDITVKAKTSENFDDVILVASIESGKNNVHWGGTPFNTFIFNNAAEKWFTIHHAIKLSDIYLNYPDVTLIVYIWNKGKKNFYIDDFTIKLRPGNPVIYGLQENIR